MLIGVTGGSGAGKSAFMDRLEELGAIVLRADAIYHELLNTNADMLKELRNRFPEAFSDGVFDRAKMRDLAFSDQQELADLNKITHPYVLDEIRREIDSLTEKKMPIAIEAIALIGSGLDKMCSVIISVSAPLETRLERIISRDGLTRKEAWERIRNQESEEYYNTHCNIVVDNNGSPDKTREGADKFWEIYVKN